jgi:hypothetical protein
MEKRIWSLEELDEERRFGIDGVELKLEEPIRRYFGIEMATIGDSLQLLQACKKGDLDTAIALIKEDPNRFKGEGPLRSRLLPARSRPFHSEFKENSQFGLITRNRDSKHRI